MIKIVTDSTAYLSNDFVRRHDIRVVPLYVHFGEEAFKEGVDISNEDFYVRLKEAPQLPTTSQPSAGEFRDVFQELASDDHQILTLTISSKLSGTWNSAMAAKDMLPDAEIAIVDSLSTASGLQLLIEAACKAIAAGASLQEISDQLEELKKKLNFFFMVDTLEYMAKGGRIGNARAFLGTVLNVKPILYLRDGAIEPLEQVRSKRKAVGRMLELLAEYLGENSSQAPLAVTHALVPDEAQAFASEIRARFGCEEPSVTELGAVIGTHTGPGIIGVATYV
jgi:DegV family protein with EDD domain